MNMMDSQFGAAIGTGLAGLLGAFMQPHMSGMNGAPPMQPPIVTPPPAIPGQQPAAVPETPQARMQRIGNAITGPMLKEFFFQGEPGDIWAERMFDLWPEDFVFMKSLGADQIVNAYRQHPAVWGYLAQRENEFISFIRQFCAYDPDAPDEGPAPAAPQQSGIIDYEEGN
jgi:hypothetical protein